MTEINQKIFFIALAILFILHGAKELKAQDKQSTPRKSFAEIVNAPIVYTVAGTSQTKIKKDIVYKTDGGLELKMDV